MEDLFNALKNQGTFLILDDIMINGYCRRVKGSERGKNVPVLLKFGIIERVDPSQFMLRFMKFENEDYKEKFLNENYYLKITDRGLVIYELLKWRKDSLNKERKHFKQSIVYERKCIANNLLKILGLELSEFTDTNDED